MGNTRKTLHLKIVTMDNLGATYAPADIAYPTDIEVPRGTHKGKLQKPQTYRERAHKDYLSVAKQGKAGAPENPESCLPTAWIYEKGS